MLRPCPVCLDLSRQKLHTQAFSLPGCIVPISYDVVCCALCGCCFADNIPRESLDEMYYTESARHLHAQRLPTGLADAHRSFFDFLVAGEEFSCDHTSVLDVGSSMGHFLNRFKAAGYNDLTGLEPSTEARALARATYALNVKSATLDDFSPGRQFDLVCACGVLEHLVDLRGAITRMMALVKHGGHCFVAVPDALRFGEQAPREPFLEFALEHINYLTAMDLDRLFAQHGFFRARWSSLWNDLYANHYLLAIYSNYSGRTINTGRLIGEHDGRKSLQTYIALSQQRLQEVEGKLKALSTTQEPLVVWGAGALTTRLSATTCLLDTNIVAVVDSNPQLHGKTILGKIIVAPERLKSLSDLTVIIASYVYGSEIRHRLVGEFAWRGPIVTL